MNDDIYKRLISLKRPGEKNRQFAARINVSQQTMSAWRTGARKPSLNTLIMISEITGEPLERFLPEGMVKGNKYKDADITRRLGAKTTRPINDSDRAQLACTYIEEMQGLSRDEKDVVKRTIKKIVDQRGRREIIRYLLALELAEKVK